MKNKSIIFFVAKIITITFVIVMLFIFGISFTKTADVDSIKQRKVNVSTLPEYQGVVEFRRGAKVDKV
ncbi:hypothetical protein HMPREF3119_02670 [Morganella sp. HMSC11D09]|uniref:hypothetical protein n=1 Tax=Morganella sp. HMSC11D09 TaxID=1581087 RepID=UPI0008A53EA3|nr:hypothetical protein [Morganella sp. HMSC11D09]OFV03013.1 hypothetical protein HMPREF3119_02670 [Morganella sp. HMSC11D09]